MEFHKRRSFEVTASTSHPFDGILRIILDAERFGFDLVRVSMTGAADSGWAIALSLHVGPAADRAVVADRLSRHPVITSVRVEEPPLAECETSAAVQSPVQRNESMPP